MPKPIGEQIKEARKEQGLSQVRLAKLCGVHEDTIANLETGRAGTKQGPTLVIIQAIGTALNTKFELWD